MPMVAQLGASSSISLLASYNVSACPEAARVQVAARPQDWLKSECEPPIAGDATRKHCNVLQPRPKAPCTPNCVPQ